MDEKEIMRELRKPFPEKDVEWRVQRAMKTKKGPKAVVLAYVDNRAIMDRLDRLFGVAGWKNEFHQWRDKGTRCRLSVKIGDEWVTKEDGADETNIESTKGGFSASMKRAAVQFGIGRYLYDLPETFVDVTNQRQKGSHYIKTNGVEGYWVPPRLPDWALPEEEKGQRGRNTSTDASDSRTQRSNNQQEKVTDNQLKAMHVVMSEIADLAGEGITMDHVKDTLKANFNYDGSCKDLTQEQAKAMMRKLNEWKQQYEKRSA